MPSLIYIIWIGSKLDKKITDSDSDLQKILFMEGKDC